MATPNIDTKGNLSRGAGFWDGVKEHFFAETFQIISNNMSDKFQRTNDFFYQTLPLLAQHFDGKALDALREAHPELAVFELSSKPNWEKAKSAFVDNGPAFIEVLAEFTDLTRFDSVITNMVTEHPVTSTQLLLAIREEIKNMKEASQTKGSRVVDEHVAQLSSTLSQEISNADKAKDITSCRVDRLLRNHINAAQDPRPYGKKHLVYLTYRWIFQSLWKQSNYKGTDITESVLSFTWFISGLMNKSWLRKTAWVDYTRRVQSFVRQVGCATVHDEPEENIAELRLFHSTTIGYFAKLQDKYLKKELEVKKLRHHITALDFRHLLEHLPDISLHQDAGPRWASFWEKALKDEADNHWNGATASRAHALTGIVEKRNPKRGYTDPSGNKVIHTKAKNGFLYVTGETLYTILSDEIHGYRGEGYNIEDDDSWTEVVTDVLRALKPINIDATTHQPEWDEERKRYVP